MKLRSFFASLGLVASLAVPAGGCPFCESRTGMQVRDGIFNADFVSNAAVALAPFPIFMCVIALLHFGPPPWLVRVRSTSDLRPNVSQDGAINPQGSGDG
jgi:hypothetical protein